MAYENLTTFTEVDTNNKWAQTVTRNTFTDLPLADGSYVYKSYGSGYFGDYDIYFDIYVTSDSQIDSRVGVWCVTDAPNYSGALLDGQGIRVKAIATKFRLEAIESGNYNSDLTTYIFNFNTTYYLRVTRTGTSFTCKIYSSISDRNSEINELDTLLFTAESSTYEYMQVGYAYNTGGGGVTIDGYTENFDLSPGPTVIQETINSDTHIKKSDIQEDINSDAYIVYRESILSDTHVKSVGIQENILSDAHISGQQPIQSDAHIKVVDIEKDILSDGHIKIIDIQEDILSDAHIRGTKQITSDAWIFGDDIQKFIVSDAHIRGIKQIVSDAKIIHGKIIDTDIRANKYPTTNIQLLEVKEGRYVNNVNITLRMTVAGAEQMRFKNETITTWSSWETFDKEKSWVLLTGDGLKKIFVQFKDINDNFSDGDEYFECVLSQTNPTSVTIEARDDYGGTPIAGGSWVDSGNILFYWRTEANVSSILGYSISMDTDPDSQINLVQQTVVISGIVPSKKVATDRTLEITSGTYYVSTEQYQASADEIELDTNVGESNPRIDVVYYDYLETDLKVVKGTNAVSPIAPILPDNVLPIAEILMDANSATFDTGDITDIRPFYIVYDNFLTENLTTGAHTLKVKSKSKADLWSTTATFNINICDLNPDIQGLKVYKTSAKLIEFFSDVVQYESSGCYIEWQDPSSPGGNTYYYTTDGSDPILSSPNTSNTFVTLGLGSGTYTIKIRAKENHCNVLGKIYTFIFKYSSEDLTSEKVSVMLDSVILKQSQKEVDVHEVKYSFRRASYCRFSRPIRFDTENTVQLDSKITVLWEGQTAFIGKVKSIHHEISPSGERVVCEAVGSREELAHRPLYKSNCAKVIYNEFENTMTIGDIFLDILKEVPGDVISSYSGPIASMDAIPGKVEFTNVTVDQALQDLVDKASHFGFYIDSNKILILVDFDSQITTNIYVGQLSQNVNNHAEYNLISCDLNYDLTGCYAKVRVEGARVRRQMFLSLIPSWSGAGEATWTYGNYLEALRGWENSDPRHLDVFRRYKIPEIYRGRIRSSLITGDGVKAYVLASFPDPDALGRQYVGIARKTVGAIAGDVTDTDIWYFDLHCKWGWYGGYQADVDIETGVVMFNEPVCGWQTTGGIALSYIKDDVGMLMYHPPWFWKKRPLHAALLCVVEEDPFVVEVGPLGTAYTQYGITRLKYIYNESFVKEIISDSVREWKKPDASLPGNVYRDDSADMTYYAEEILEGVKDAKYNGTLIVDGIDLSIKPDNKLNIFNTDKSEWTTMGSNIIDVTYNFDTESMRLTLTSERGLI